MHTSSPKHTYSTRRYIVTLFLCACVLSCYTHGQLFATLWTVTHQAPLSTGFSRQEYRSGLPCPSPGDCPNPGIEPMSPEAPALQEGSLPLSHWGSPTLFVRTQRKIQMLVNNKTDTIVEYSYWGVLYNKEKKRIITTCSKSHKRYAEQKKLTLYRSYEHFHSYAVQNIHIKMELACDVKSQDSGYFG